MGEGKGAVASGIAGIGLPGLTWGLDKMGIEVPYSVAVAISIVSVVLIMLSLALASHLLWQRIGGRQGILNFWNKNGKRPVRLFALMAASLVIGWLIGSQGIDTFWHTFPNMGPIVWNLEDTARGRGYFLDMQRPPLNQEMIVAGFGAHGKNISSEPINDFDGYLRSDKNNERLPIYILAADAAVTNACTLLVPTLPGDTHGIPAFADFNISTSKKPIFINRFEGMPLSRFLNEFVPFTIVMKYDGKPHQRHFTREEVDKQIAILEKLAGPSVNPYVIRKSTAPAVTIAPPLSTLIPPNTTPVPDVTGKVPER